MSEKQNYKDNLITVLSKEQKREETFHFAGKFIPAASSRQHTFKPWHVNKNR